MTSDDDTLLPQDADRLFDVTGRLAGSQVEGSLKRFIAQMEVVLA